MGNAVGALKYFFFQTQTYLLLQNEMFMKGLFFLFYYMMKNLGALSNSYFLSCVFFTMMCKAYV